MAVHTLGTNANNSITKALTWLPGFNSGIATADMATVAEAFKDDQNVTHPLAGLANAPFGPGVSYYGTILIPNRGILKMLPGDVFAVDSRGWPILLSKDTIANGPWHFV